MYQLELFYFLILSCRNFLITGDTNCKMSFQSEFSKYFFLISINLTRYFSSIENHAFILLYYKLNLTVNYREKLRAPSNIREICHQWPNQKSAISAPNASICKHFKLTTLCKKIVTAKGNPVTPNQFIYPNFHLFSIIKFSNYAKTFARQIFHIRT